MKTLLLSISFIYFIVSFIIVIYGDLPTGDKQIKSVINLLISVCVLLITTSTYLL